MNWTIHSLSFLPGKFLSVAEIDNDIDDEFEFHIQSRIEDLRAEGMNYQQAETAARAAFGSQASIRRQCQQINYGSRIWWNRLSLVALLFCGIAISGLVYQLANERSRNHQLLIELANANSDFSDVFGQIVDSKGQPIPNADLCITVKTWPNGKYNQEQFTTRSDQHGKFNYPQLLPNKKSYALNLAASKAGYGFVSRYVKKPSETPRSFKPLILTMRPADNFQLQLRYQHNDQPVADSLVILVSRYDGDQEHLSYDFGTGPTTFKTDSAGLLELPFVRLEDELELQIQSSNGQDVLIESVLVNQNQAVHYVENWTTGNSY